MSLLYRFTQEIRQGSFGRPTEPPIHEREHSRESTRGCDRTSPIRFLPRFTFGSLVQTHEVDLAIVICCNKSNRVPVVHKTGRPPIEWIFGTVIGVQEKHWMPAGKGREIIDMNRPQRPQYNQLNVQPVYACICEGLLRVHNARETILPVWFGVVGQRQKLLGRAETTTGSSG